MKIGKLYFENLLDLGDLYLYKSGISYDQSPLCFLCRNKHKKLFLCFTIEIRYVGEYLITPINRWNYYKLFHNKITIKEAFERGKALYYDYYENNVGDSYIKLSSQDRLVYIDRFIPDEPLEYPDFV